jgi:hypothetical protein
MFCRASAVWQRNAIAVIAQSVELRLRGDEIGRGLLPPNLSPK